MTILYILLKLTNTENEGHYHLLWLAILLHIRLCLCYSLVLQIQGQKRKKPTKPVKTKEFRWGRGKDLPTDFNRNLMGFIEFWKKKKYFVPLLLHVKNCPWSPPVWLGNWGCHTDRRRTCRRFLMRQSGGPENSSQSVSTCLHWKRL